MPTAFFRYYRLSRAIGAALVLVLAIGAMLWASRREPTFHHTTGSVTAVVASKILNDQQRIARVRLPDGREAGIILPVFIADVGREIPLILESYDDGKTHVMFDSRAWLDHP